MANEWICVYEQIELQTNKDRDRVTPNVVVICKKVEKKLKKKLQIFLRLIHFTYSRISSNNASFTAEGMRLKN